MSDQLEPDVLAFRETLIGRMEQWFPNDDAYDHLDLLLNDATRAGYELGVTTALYDTWAARVCDLEEERDELKATVNRLHETHKLTIEHAASVMQERDRLRRLVRVKHCTVGCTEHAEHYFIVETLVGPLPRDIDSIAGTPLDGMMTSISDLVSPQSPLGCDVSVSAWIGAEPALQFEPDQDRSDV